MTEISSAIRPRPAETTVIAVLIAISSCHFLNDMMQSMLPALYPQLKDSLGLGFSQIGLITLVYQITASLLQPVVGLVADRRPRPYALALGMGFTFVGLLLLSRSAGFISLLAAAALIGVGSSIFHPEASRVARLASGGRHGFAQSLFQVGGNFGSAIGPLIAAFLVLPRGQGSVAWVAVAALVGMAITARIGGWYRDHLVAKAKLRSADAVHESGLSRRTANVAIAVLLLLVFSKYLYLASLTSYYTFYLIEKFHVSVQTAQIHLFAFLGAVAAGTIFGGPLGDRFGRRRVIWISILGVLPFTLALPFASLFWTGALTIAIGALLASAFPAIVVFAQEVMPGKIGMVAGLFFGFAFGVGGVGAAALGWLADATSIGFVYRICAFLPAIGILAVFLPDLSRLHTARAAASAE